MKMRLIALHGGGDWYDASCNYLKIPEGLTREQAQKEYKEFCARTYSPRTPEWCFFDEWLILYKGASGDIEDSELEVWSDD